MDRSVAEAGASLTTDLLNDAAVMGVELYALKQLGDAAVANAAAQKARMTEPREKRIRGSIARWAESNPGSASKLFGFLVMADPLLWVGDIVRQCKAIADQGKQLRQPRPGTDQGAQPPPLPPPLPTPNIN